MKSNKYILFAKPEVSDKGEFVIRTKELKYTPGIDIESQIKKPFSEIKPTEIEFSCKTELDEFSNAQKKLNKALYDDNVKLLGMEFEDKLHYWDNNPRKDIFDAESAVDNLRNNLEKKLLKVCKNENYKEIIKAKTSLAKIKDIEDKVGRNKETIKRIKFLNGVLGLYSEWFIENDLSFPDNPKKKPSSKKKNIIGKPLDDQDDFIDKFRDACRKRKLVKNKTIKSETLFKIGKDICFSEMPKLIDSFKDGNKTYHKLRQYASLTGYKKKRIIK